MFQQGGCERCRRIKQSTAEAAAAEIERMDEKLVVSHLAESQHDKSFFRSWCIW